MRGTGGQTHPCEAVFKNPGVANSLRRHLPPRGPRLQPRLQRTKYSCPFVSIRGRSTRSNSAALPARRIIRVNPCASVVKKTRGYRIAFGGTFLRVVRGCSRGYSARSIRVHSWLLNAKQFRGGKTGLLKKRRRGVATPPPKKTHQINRRSEAAIEADVDRDEVVVDRRRLVAETAVDLLVRVEEVRDVERELGRGTQLVSDADVQRVE